MNKFDGEPKRELSGAEQTKNLVDRGFKISRIFKEEQNADFEAYIKELKTQGKKPNEDFAFIIDKDLEGVSDVNAETIGSRVIKVFEKF